MLHFVCRYVAQIKSCEITRFFESQNFNPFLCSPSRLSEKWWIKFELFAERLANFSLRLNLREHTLILKGTLNHSSFLPTRFSEIALSMRLNKNEFINLTMANCMCSQTAVSSVYTEWAGPSLHGASSDSRPSLPGTRITYACNQDPFRKMCHWISITNLCYSF